MTTIAPARPVPRTRRHWRVPTALLVLTAVPALAGSVRVAELASGPERTADNARFLDQPVPILLHIVGATVFCVLGAFQFAPGLRRHAWHRIAGRLVLPCGLIGAVAGLWLAAFRPLPAHDGPLLMVFRLVFGTGMVAALVLAFVAVRNREFRAHRAWVIRGYAIAQGAGTQAVLFGVGSAVGEVGVTARALLMGLAWVINLGVAEWAIRKGSR